MSTDNPQTNPSDANAAPAPESAAGGTQSPEASAPDQVTAAQAERDAALQKWLLAVADLENYRRRVQKEAEQERRYAVLPLARDILPALDNLQRAIDAARNGGDIGKLVDGVQMVMKSFEEAFAKHSIVPIGAQGQPFDPNLHQAIQQMPSADQPPLTVLNELERGFKMHDRVVRPSTVIVSAPAS